MDPLRLCRRLKIILTGRSGHRLWTAVSRHPHPATSAPRRQAVVVRPRSGPLSVLEMHRSINNETRDYSTFQMVTTVTSERSADPQFHLFTKLPGEIQALIWKFAREDQPVLRHYMLLARGGRREYATVDLKTRQLASPVARSAQYNRDIPAEPALSKIHFPKGVRWVRRTRHPGSKSEDTVHPRASAAWVDFNRDIFFIANSEFDRPGQMRFLLGDAKRKTKTISAQHWAKRIQRLSLDVYAYTGPPSNDGEMPTHIRNREIKLDELDLRILPELDSLKVLFLVVKMRFTYWAGDRKIYWRETPAQDCLGFTNVDDALMAIHICDEGVPSYCPVEPVVQRAGILKAQLESILNTRGKTVDVRIVIDPLRETYLYHDK
jgi:hypothetical protein